MFDKLNKAAQEVVKVAMACRRQHLASEIYSYLPITDESEFQQFEAQVRVVKTLLRLRPTYSQRLKVALAALVAETDVVGRSLQ